jgi:hypothetical protein
MTRFLGNWEVETDIILPKDIPFLRYDTSDSAYTVFLRNVLQPREGLTYLSMQVVFDASDLSHAKETGQQVAKEFLDYLTLVSSLKLRLRRLFQIFNWELGAGMRECLYFSPSASHDDAPYEALDAKILETVAILQKQPLNPRLRRAMKWFANGVASPFPDDQFTYFWFVVELIAQLVKNPSPIPDRCPMCQEPLHCTSCGTTPLHRPYPKQAIKQLFTKYGPKAADAFYHRASEARNMLLHGEETLSIEAALKINFAELVDDMGKIAWVSLVNQFSPVMIGTTPSFIRTSRFVQMNLTGTAHMHVGFTPNFENPDPAHFPKVEFTMVPTPPAPKPTASAPHQ